MKETDESIIARVLDGDRNAYALLVDRYKDRVFSLAMGIVRHRETAEEVALDAFIKAYNSLPTFRKEASFSSWLYRIAYNTAISESRKNKKYSMSFDEQLQRSVQYTPAETDEEETLEARKLALNRAMQELAPEDRLILMLYYFEEKSVEDISEVTGLSPSNTKVKLFRMRNKLRSIMEQSLRAARVWV